MGTLRWFANHKYSLLCSLGFALLSVSLLTPLLIHRGTPTLRMSAGPDGTRRHAVAVYLAEQAARHHLAMNLQTCSSTGDCLEQLKSDDLDVAIVCNGVVVPEHDDIKVLGAIQLEAMHVLVRRGMANGVPLSEAIRGKRVNLGEPGSTERLLAHDLLEFTRLRLPSGSQVGDVVPTELSKAELIARAEAILQSKSAEKHALLAELPDCLIVLATMPSTVVQLLIEAADYQIVPLPATRAFLMDNLQGDHAKTTVLDREYLERTAIPMDSYFTTRGHPAADCETIGVRLLVVARKSVPDQAIRPLMQTLFEGEFPRRIPPRSPRDLATPYAVHPAAGAFLDRHNPLPINDIMETITRILTIFGAVSAGALAVCGLLWRKKIRRPADYFAEIRKVELIAHGVQADARAPIKPVELVKYLDDRLVRLRHQLIEDICEDHIKGDQVIANILALLKDAQRNLHRLAESAATGVAKLRIDDAKASLRAS